MVVLRGRRGCSDRLEQEQSGRGREGGASTRIAFPIRQQLNATAACKVMINLCQASFAVYPKLGRHLSCFASCYCCCCCVVVAAAPAADVVAMKLPTTDAAAATSARR